MRTSASLLRQVTWQDIDAMTFDISQHQWTQWLAPDKDSQLTDPVILNFVQRSLPATYRSVLTPYDTARTLHKAVVGALTYGNPLHGDAVHVLQDGVAGCGGFSALLVATLRAVGIPARLIGGFWQGTLIWHFRVEFHLPGTEWIVADPSQADYWDPTGTYAFEFGFSPTANGFVAVDVGDVHNMSYSQFANLQLPLPYWIGGQFISYTPESSLEPVTGNVPPQISLNSVTPSPGSTTIKVKYSDPDGDPPAYVTAQVVGTGGTACGTYPMSAAPSQTMNYVSGVIYCYNVDGSANLAPGTYNVNVTTTDGLSAPVALPPIPIQVVGTTRPRLSISKGANRTATVTVTQVPTQGSVIVETSTNLHVWTALSTNSATGVPLSIPLTASRPTQFFRARTVQ